jgi:CDAN1-interacting nuclease 1
MHLNHVKNASYRVKSQAKEHADRYKQGESILSLARQNHYPPYLFARCIVEEITNFRGRKGLTDAMRDPVGRLGDASVILEAYRASEQVESIYHEQIRRETFSNQPVPEAPLTRLATEVIDIMARDPMYGPKHDAERSRVGIEYEIILEQCLRATGIPFETEEQLRERGSARTPDILLSIPVGVQVSNSEGGTDWKVVCWIDSKALFGDEGTHKDTIQGQAESYVHRFGPGLVLYWFGHAPVERLDDSQGDIVICGWKLPDELLLPSGEIVREGQTARSLLHPSN